MVLVLMALLVLCARRMQQSLTLAQKLVEKQREVDALQATLKQERSTIDQLSIQVLSLHCIVLDSCTYVWMSSLSPRPSLPVFPIWCKSRQLSAAEKQLEQVRQPHNYLIDQIRAKEKEAAQAHTLAQQLQLRLQ